MLFVLLSTVHAQEAVFGGNGSGAVNSSTYSSVAQKCGLEIEPLCTPDKVGGRHLCGHAVGQMVQCLARDSMGVNCSGSCGGSAKDMIGCTDGFLSRCGYQKVVPTTSSLCKTAGAVRVYASTPTTQGRVHGHAEFVSAQGEYVSIYDHPLDRPWPRDVPDGCWFPAKNGVLPAAPILPSSVGGTTAASPAASYGSAPMPGATPAFGDDGLGGALLSLMPLLKSFQTSDDPQPLPPPTYPISSLLNSNTLPGARVITTPSPYPLSNTQLPTAAPPIVPFSPPQP